MSKPKTSTCRVGSKRWFSGKGEALEAAKKEHEKSGIQIFIYYCRWTPCAYMHMMHLTKNVPIEPKDIKANGPLFEYYRNKGNKGKGSRQAKNQRISRARRRKAYMEYRFPIESWENEGGAL